MVVHELAAAAGHTAVLVSSDRAPVEVHALEAGQLRPLSAHNQALFGSCSWDRSRISPSGARRHGRARTARQATRLRSGRRYPTIVWIHGGPNGQDDHSLELQGYGPPLERQLFATHGFVVLAINYRAAPGAARNSRAASSPTGATRKSRTCSPGRLHGRQGNRRSGALRDRGLELRRSATDYVIASDTRFKAAISVPAAATNSRPTARTIHRGIQRRARAAVAQSALWLKVSIPSFTRPDPHAHALPGRAKDSRARRGR